MLFLKLNIKLYYMDNTLILSLTAMILGFAAVTIKICFASKCTDVELCCIKIHRNVEIEPVYYNDTNNNYNNRNNSTSNNVSDNNVSDNNVSDNNVSDNNVSDNNNVRVFNPSE